jgi:hypothetical protein
MVTTLYITLKLTVILSSNVLYISIQPVSKKRSADADEAPAAKKAKNDSQSGESSTVFVGNLSFNVDEDTLAQEFAEAGEVTGVRIITDASTGRKKGLVDFLFYLFHNGVALVLTFFFFLTFC